MFQRFPLYKCERRQFTFAKNKIKGLLEATSLINLLVDEYQLQMLMTMFWKRRFLKVLNKYGQGNHVGHETSNVGND